MPDIAVFEFEWDDENLDKIAQRVDPEEIDHMIDDRFITLRNSRSRTGEYIVVGRGQEREAVGGQHREHGCQGTLASHQRGAADGD